MFACLSRNLASSFLGEQSEVRTPEPERCQGRWPSIAIHSQTDEAELREMLSLSDGGQGRRARKVHFPEVTFLW